MIQLFLFCICRPHTEFSNESYYNYDETVTSDVSSESVDSNETPREDAIDEDLDELRNVSSRDHSFVLLVVIS